MSSATRVLICNERFLPRFGVDRLLVLLAEHLTAQGVEVAFACLRCDRTVLERVSSDIEEIALPTGVAFTDIDGFVSRHLLARWTTERPDVVVSGGWPFFGAAAQASALGLGGVFIDAGATAQDGFSPNDMAIQLELRRLRQRTLPQIATILPISDFIRVSQTEPDRGSSQGVHTVLLGADHLAGRTFDQAAPSKDERAAIAALKRISDRGGRLALGLGRFEARGYKNSPALFHIARSLCAAGTPVHLVLLGGPHALGPPEDLVDAVTILGQISDAALLEVMQLCTIGLSPTLWEGFNLPLAEMQWLGKPVFAYDIGAHPEVVADPWFLSESSAELIDKAASLLAGRAPARLQTGECFKRFRERLRWSDTLEQWTQFIVQTPPPPKPARRMVLVDVSNAARDPANSGVIRVTRRLTAELDKLAQFDMLFVRWDWTTRAYALLTADQQPFLSSNSGPTDWLGMAAEALGDSISVDSILAGADPGAGSPPILFFTEIVLDGSAEARIDWARERGLAIAALFYDMLPVYESQHVNPDIVATFPSYLEGLCAMDAVWAISGFSLHEFRRYTTDLGMQEPATSEALWLPGQFGDHPRAKASAPAADEIEILCVSTIEPRKNHRILVQAFQLLGRRRPDLSVRLVLVGNSYAGCEDLTNWLRERQLEDERIVWHGAVSDANLTEHYKRCAFTVYPSLAEGFGLPILESLWMARPCLCHKGGVMAELAADGGCLTVDMTDVAQVADGLAALASNPALRGVLTAQAVGRPIDRWRDYAGAVADRLQQVAR